MAGCRVAKAIGILFAAAQSSVGEGLARVSVPDPCGVVFAGGHNACAVWTERCCEDRALMHEGGVQRVAQL